MSVSGEDQASKAMTHHRISLNSRLSHNRSRSSSRDCCSIKKSYKSNEKQVLKMKIIDVSRSSNMSKSKSKRKSTKLTSVRNSVSDDEMTPRVIEEPYYLQNSTQ